LTRLGNRMSRRAGCLCGRRLSRRVYRLRALCPRYGRLVGIRTRGGSFS
jgi:hypothetical protein